MAWWGRVLIGIGLLGIAYMTIWTDDPGQDGEWLQQGDGPTLQSTEFLTINRTRGEFNYDTPIVIEDIDENPKQFDQAWAVSTNKRGSTAITVGFTKEVSTNAMIREGNLKIWIAVRRSSSGGFDPFLNVGFYYNGASVAVINHYKEIGNGADGELVLWELPWSTLVGVVDTSLIELFVGGTVQGVLANKKSLEIGSAALELHFEGNEAAWDTESPGDTAWDTPTIPSTQWS